MSTQEEKQQQLMSGLYQAVLFRIKSLIKASLKQKKAISIQ